MFASKVVASARALNVSFRVVRDVSVLETLDGRGLIADLNQDGFIEAATSWKTLRGGRIVGFVSHVDTPIIVAARAAGFDRVLTRSQFSQSVDQVLTELCG